MRYICDPHVIPTVVPRDFAEIKAYAERCSEYTDSLHIDVTDGAFASSVTWPLANPNQAQEVAAFSRIIGFPLKLEAHLMVQSPENLGSQFAQAGFQTVIGHIEAFEDAAHARQALERWKKSGAQEVGIAILLETPLEILDEAIPSCDLVHMMSIAKIGSQGQNFDDRVLTRVEELHAKYPDLLVSVDGGVTEATVESLVRAGANRMTVGAALSRSTEPAATYARILERAMKGCAPRESLQSTVYS